MPNLFFLIDVDNTLIDNDFVKRDLEEHIKVQMGETLNNRYCTHSLTLCTHMHWRLFVI